MLSMVLRLSPFITGGPSPFITGGPSPFITGPRRWLLVSYPFPPASLQTRSLLLFLALDPSFSLYLSSLLSPSFTPFAPNTPPPVSTLTPTYGSSFHPLPINLLSLLVLSSTLLFLLACPLFRLPPAPPSCPKLSFPY